MTPEPRYCITCAHYHPGTPSDCRAPENVRADLVTGQPKSWSADTQRHQGMGCGIAGIWWMPKDKQEA